MFGFSPDIMKQAEDSGLTNIFNYLPRAKTGVSSDTELFKVDS